MKWFISKIHLFLSVQTRVIHPIMLAVIDPCKIHSWCFSTVLLVAHSGRYEGTPKWGVHCNEHFHAAKGKERHDAGELAVDRLAIVFIPLQENWFFSWRTSGLDRTPGSKGKSYSERLKTDQKLSEDEHCSKLKEQINCNACVFIILLWGTKSYQAFWAWVLFMPPCYKYTWPELQLA